MNKKLLKTKNGEKIYTVKFTFFSTEHKFQEKIVLKYF